MSSQLGSTMLVCLQQHIHMLEQLSQQKLTSHCSGGWKAKIKVLAHLASLCPVRYPPHTWSHTPSTCPFFPCEDTIHSRLGLNSYYLT